MRHNSHLISRFGGRQRPLTTRLIFLLCAVLCFNCSTRAQTHTMLAWSDEFNGAAGAAVDGAKWGFDTGGGGWGNNELEYYTNSTANAATDGAGNLVITAQTSTLRKLRCWYGQCQYTSARLLTKGKFQQTYGRFEARIRVPYGQGLWPAFWMLGANISTVNWPNCGEIDIMENIGREPATVHGTIHGPGYSGANGIGAPYSLATGAFSDNYHVYAVEWDPNQIRWYVDGNLYQTRTPADLPAGTTWVFDHPFFLIMNVAVGGYWPGNPDATTVFPQRMYVDYVRVYQ
jgi:beta-glucanase (GH16 family)